MVTSARAPCLTSMQGCSSAIACPQQVAACLLSTHFGAFVSTTEGSARLSCASNHQTTQLAVPSVVPERSTSFRGGTSCTSATPSSSERSSVGSVRIRKSPSRLSRSTPIQSPSSKRPAGQKGQSASMFTPASAGNRTSHSTASSRKRAGMTGAPSWQSRWRAPRVSRMRFSPRPPASMSSLTKTSNLSDSGGRDTPRTSVHQISSGASSSGGSGASSWPSRRRFKAMICSESRAMAVTTSTPTPAVAPARKAIIESMPSPLPTSSTRQAPLRARAAATSARRARSYASCRAPSLSIS
mmetsp:Transcript_65619/g.207352  ORF Transcript_65619/g.207352 Transcript_65619/m.207352 type:complete len:298 (-) Transcript_65619:384-1277(-)